MLVPPQDRFVVIASEPFKPYILIFFFIFRLGQVTDRALNVFYQSSQFLLQSKPIGVELNWINNFYIRWVMD